MEWRSGKLGRLRQVAVGLLGAVVVCSGGWAARRLLHSERVTGPTMPAAFAGVMPRRVLWAWEEPEDLHTLSPGVGVAYLAETLIVGERTAVLPRRQPLRAAAGAPVMAVVRLEARRGFADSPELRGEVARLLAGVGRRDGVRALQVDFDAAASQIEFYGGVLRMLRPLLPEGMPLSMTALVSWCGPHSWLRTVPVDEAVPMLFRMGGPRRVDAGRDYRMADPLCRTSLGLSTDEPWPAEVTTRLDAGRGARVYLFAPRPWEQAQLRAVEVSATSSLGKELAQ